MRAWPRRSWLLAVLLAFCAFLALFFSVNSGSQDEPTPEQRMHRFINERRDDLGLRKLEVTDFLKRYATDRSRVMRENGRLRPHDPCQGCSEVLGTTGGGPWRLFLAWLGSSVHHDILLDRDATRLGCGMVHDGLVDWWTCELRS